MSERYNGWTNYETWNVALWIGNDEGLYNLAREFSGRAAPYEAFRESMKEAGGGFGSKIAWQTPDGVRWNDDALDVDELDEMMGEL